MTAGCAERCTDETGSLTANYCILHVYARDYKAKTLSFIGHKRCNPARINEFDRNQGKISTGVLAP